ncbi:Remorin family protein [Perilla frutescens var. hirtella]|nr:Remorin family protein [Perilla frutescens var. hirtella]
MAAPAIRENGPAAPPPEDAQAPSNAALAKLEHEKKLSFIKAWEESRKSRVENRAERKQAKVSAWEKSKKASVEARLKKIEERMERKKAEYAEKLKNKEAEIHKKAEEKRAVVEASKGQEILKAEEMAAKYRDDGHLPHNTLFKCFKP